MLGRRGVFSLPALGALFVLVLNDHVLKHACPSALTGKLSDFAGLFLFPVLAGALAGRRSTIVARASAIAGAAAFALCKLLPAAAGWVSLHVATTTCDPTDLVALPMLWLGARHAAPMSLADVARWRDRIAAALCAFASIATSAQHQPMPPQAPVAVVAAPRRCVKVTVAGIEPRASEVVVHAHLEHDEPNGLRCDVTLVASLDSAPSDRVATKIRGKSSVVSVDPGRAVDVAITLVTPYPMTCNPPPKGIVESYERPDGYPEEARPAWSAPIHGCITAMAAAP
jgi:hypothetical protein